MRDLFQIPRKFHLPDKVRNELSIAPLVVVDVGGAMGLDDRWASVRTYLDLITFEPDQRSKADGVVIRKALGGEEADARTLHLSALPAASSLYTHHPEMKNFVVADWIEVTGQEEIPITTLDHSVGDRKIDFLKIDAEGADLEILEGATATLKNVLAIQVEVSFAQRHLDAPRFADIDRYLNERGFHLHSFTQERWLRNNAVFGANVVPQIMWGDAVYLRTEMNESDFPKWALILQAYGFQDYAIDKMPDEWVLTMKKSVRSHLAFFLMLAWRWGVATLLLPLFGARAWRKWKHLASLAFFELHRLTCRQGPRKGIFSSDCPGT